MCMLLLPILFLRTTVGQESNSPAHIIVSDHMVWEIQKGGEFEGYPESGLRRVFDTCLDLSKGLSPNVFEEIVENLGDRQLRGYRSVFPYVADAYGEEPDPETGVGICRCKDRIYTKSIAEYYEEMLEEERPGVEMFEEWVAEAEGEHMSLSSVDIPEDICGEDEYIGTIHTHPNYPCTPSKPDVREGVEKKHQVTCISSKDRFMCLITEPGEAAPARRDDYGEFDTIEGETHLSAEELEEMSVQELEEEGLELGTRSVCIPARFSTYMPGEDERVEFCPVDYQRGHERAYIDEIRKEMDQLSLRGVCYYDKKEGNVVRCHGRSGMVEYRLDRE